MFSKPHLRITRDEQDVGAVKHVRNQGNVSLVAETGDGLIRSALGSTASSFRVSRLPELREELQVLEVIVSSPSAPSTYTSSRCNHFSIDSANTNSSTDLSLTDSKGPPWPTDTPSRSPHSRPGMIYSRAYEVASLTS